MKDSNRLTRLKIRLSEVGKTTYIVRRAYAVTTARVRRAPKARTTRGRVIKENVKRF